MTETLTGLYVAIAIGVAWELVRRDPIPAHTDDEWERAAYVVLYGLIGAAWPIFAATGVLLLLARGIVRLRDRHTPDPEEGP